jgi:energy-coupling factor transporter ATP-binding protein EcfA2
LEIEINNNLVALGLVNWTITFDIERENKSGSITKGFSVLINDPTGQTVKYESLSGGEGQRVRLAGCFGLANLITERAGLSNRIEFYDELSQHMSDEGIEDMLNTLRDRAINSEKQIYVIDHRSIDYGDFTETIQIIKDENGSRLT